MKDKMTLEAIDCEMLKQALVVGKRLLEEHVEEINRLNVFPVPDGDTGTNMLLTMDAVVQGLDGDGTSLSQVMQHVSRKALLGARGNSGVILAQFLVGFAAAVGDKEAVDADALANGFTRGTDEAYRIVSHPQEGTILTIMCAARDAIVRVKTRPLTEIVAAAYDDARETLARTPEMLPILKRAGVIDAGGLGFVYLLSALVAVLDDEEPHPSDILDDRFMQQSDAALEKIQKEGPPTHRYCTEFIVQGRNIPRATLREKLDRQADSVLILEDAGLTHVHLHTDDPGDALQIAAEYGRVFQVKVDDMYEQVNKLLHDDDRTRKVKQETKVVAVSPGEGISEILRSVGADEVFTGNPAVGDLIEAIMRVGGNGVILLPNDPNILLACRQAGRIIRSPTAIIPSKSVPQGISALLAYDTNQGLEENVETMQRAMAHVRSGSIGRAARPSTLNEVKVTVGEYVGMLERQIVVASKTIDDVIIRLLELMDVSSAEVVTLFYGLDVQERDAATIASRIRDHHRRVEVQVYYGGQASYDYLISVE